jgi:hypothetical protein
MEKIDYELLIKTIDKYSVEACRIFNKLHNEDLKSKTNIIHYGKSAYFERVEWEESDKNNICIRYYDFYYDLYDYSTFCIPASILFNDEKIDKWIQGIITDELKKRVELKKKEELINEEKEKLEYERLKAKFEN